MNQQSTILDYTSFIRDVFQEFPNQAFYSSKEMEHCIRTVRDSGLCPYCRAKYEKVYVEQSESAEMDVSESICYSCMNCGWWFVRNVHEDGSYADNCAIALLQQFDVSDKELPISTLEMELRRHPELVRRIHPRKLEELVASVLKDFFDTEGFLLGKTGDGGIDLLYLRGDSPVAVQVKRRLSDDAVEGVFLVREFLGAMVLKGFRRGVIVSTADRFQKGAQEAAQMAVRKQVVDSFELIDCENFLGMFRLASRRANYPWEEVFYDYAIRDRSGLFIRVLLNKSTILEKSMKSSRDNE